MAKATGGLGPQGGAPVPPEVSAIREEMKKGIGRPTVYTEELANKIVANIRLGNYLEVAAAAAGIHRTTLQDWLKRGAKGDEPFAEFSSLVEKAQAEAEQFDVTQILKAAKNGQWQAAAWRLERKFPSRWGRKDQTKLIHEGVIETNKARDYSKLSTEELETLEGLLAKCGGGSGESTEGVGEA